MKSPITLTKSIAVVHMLSIFYKSLFKKREGSILGCKSRSSRGFHVGRFYIPVFEAFYICLRILKLGWNIELGGGVKSRQGTQMHFFCFFVLLKKIGKFVLFVFICVFSWIFFYLCWKNV